MKFKYEDGNLDFALDRCYVAGWTGRNEQSVKHHIQELSAIGVAPPSTVPLYYRVSNTLLTHDQTIDVLGNGTSGEVEPMLIQQDGETWIGLASDHTDRELEAHSVAASKQICQKPVSHELWKYKEVKNHIDSLILRCSINENKEWVVYQEGTLVNIRPLEELMKNSGFGDNAVMLCGTLPAIGGVRTATVYKMQLQDPVRDMEITLEYKVSILPMIA